MFLLGDFVTEVKMKTSLEILYFHFHHRKANTQKSIKQSAAPYFLLHFNKELNVDWLNSSPKLLCENEMPRSRKIDSWTQFSWGNLSSCAILIWSEGLQNIFQIFCTPSMTCMRNDHYEEWVCWQKVANNLTRSPVSKKCLLETHFQIKDKYK